MSELTDEKLAKMSLEDMKNMKEPDAPKAQIPWCNLGYTVEESKEKCPLGGCWRFRCFKSKFNDLWHKKKIEHDAARFK